MNKITVKLLLFKTKCITRCVAAERQESYDGKKAYYLHLQIHSY